MFHLKGTLYVLMSHRNYRHHLGSVCMYNNVLVEIVFWSSN